MSDGQSGAGVNYFSGEFLARDDFADEQANQYARRARTAAGLNGSGIVAGLDVSRLDDGSYRVSPGSALDGLGRLVRLTMARSIAAPPASASGALSLTIAFSVVPVSTGSDIGYAEESPVLAWTPVEDRLDDSAPVTRIVLAQLTDASDTTPDMSVRVYAATRVGTLDLLPKAGGRPAQIAGWSRGTRYGLVIRADDLALTPHGTAPVNIRIPDGAIAVGTMALAASLDIAPQADGEPGPGTLTSRGSSVRFSDASARALILPGVILSVTGTSGDIREATVIDALANGDVIVSADLDCQAAPWRFIRPLVFRLAPQSGPPALAVGDTGNTAFGALPGQARARIQGGGLTLAGEGRTLTIGASAALGATSGGRIGFEPASNRLAIEAPDQFMMSLPAQPWTSVLNLSGDLGLGTDTPGTRLDVEGFIQSTQGGFVFPDGSIQASAEISVPVGAVIDWWPGNNTIEIPPNYRICDGDTIQGTGTSADGHQTPNLQHLFVVGVTDIDQIGESRGNPVHDHSFLNPSHVHAFPHTHPDLSDRTTSDANDSDGMSGVPENNARKNHTHPFSAPVGTQSEANTGDSSEAGAETTTGEAAPMPPYVGLIKLVRVL